MRVLINAVTVSRTATGNWTYLRGLLGGWQALGGSDRLLVVAHPTFPEADEAALSAVAEVRRTAGGRAQRALTQHTRLDGLARTFAAHAVLNATPVAAAIVPVRRAQATVVHDIRHAVRPQEFGRLQLTYRRLVYNRTIRRSTVVIASSESSRADIERHFGLGPERLKMVPLAADHADAWRQAGPPGSHAVAFAQWSNKRPDVALRAWALLRDSTPGFDRRLDVIGARGQLRAELEQLAAGLALDGLVRFHGYLPDDDYERLFATAALILVPSTLEGFGLPVLEGMRLGIPVVASAGAGIEQAGGSAALYAEAGNAEAFAAHCHRLLTDEAHRRAVVAGALTHAAGYTWRSTAQATRAVLREAALRRRHARD